MLMPLQQQTGKEPMSKSAPACCIRASTVVVAAFMRPFTLGICLAMQGLQCNDCKATVSKLISIRTCSVLDPLFWRRMNIDDTLRQQLTELPGTKTLTDLLDRATGLSQMKVTLPPLNQS